MCQGWCFLVFRKTLNDEVSIVITTYITASKYLGDLIEEYYDIKIDINMNVTIDVNINATNTDKKSETKANEPSTNKEFPTKREMYDYYGIDM